LTYNDTVYVVNLSEGETQVLRISINLQDEIAQRFLEIKKHWGLESNTDVLRMLITWYYDEMTKKKLE